MAGEPGLVARWPFDGRTRDVVGGHDGELLGEATFGEPAPTGG